MVLAAARPAVTPVADRATSLPTPAREIWPQLMLVAVVLLAALLRLPALAVNPGWDGDEGYNYNIALNLAAGRHQMFGLDFVFVQHPPLYFALTALLFRLLGPSMVALRLLAVAYALGTLALLPALARAVRGPEVGVTARHPAVDYRRAGLLAALLYAVWPFVLTQNRFGYTYTGLAFWTALTLLALLHYRQRPSWHALLLTGLAATAALTTDQEGLYLLPLLIGGLWSAPWRQRLALLSVALSGPVLYLGALLWADHPALLFDLTHTAGRVTGGTLLHQAITWLYNLADLMRIDLLLPLGLAGLVLAPRSVGRRLLLLLLVSMLAVILKVRDPNPLFRTAEPLLPFVCLGGGLLLTALSDRVVVGLRSVVGLRGRSIALLPTLLLIVPLCYDIQRIATRLPTPIESLLPRSPAEATLLARWLNARLRSSDLVLAMPQVSWQLRAQTAELLQAVAVSGRATAFYPADLSCARWVYDVRLTAARYLVVDHFTTLWIAQNGAERALVTAARRWPRVYQRGEYTVYANPAPAPRSVICGHRATH